MMRVGILGGGLSAISLAYFLQNSCARDCTIDILEKRNTPGGLCRSFPFAGVHYDIGPHVMFSKNEEILDLMVRMLGDNVHKLRRSNRIFHDGRFVKYPFENELSALAPAERDWCVEAFLDNPYGGYPAHNMLQFFLSTFGEGITNLYLRPYNEKLWKFDPAFMDTQMVERIPRPPADDILRSAKGETTEGYTHQLHFYYPKHGGIQSLVDGFLQTLNWQTAVRTGATVERVVRDGPCWRVSTSDGATRNFDRLVSTIPVPELVRCIEPAVPERVACAAKRLRFNAIAICMLHVRRDRLGDNFAIMVPDADIIFHRVSKLNFLFPEGVDDGTSHLVVEVTYRNPAQLTDGELMNRIVADLERVGFIAGEEVLARKILWQQYAYVIYDYAHRFNMGIVRDYCEKDLGIFLHGRFGEFDYINMDAAVARSSQRFTAVVNGRANQ